MRAIARTEHLELHADGSIYLAVDTPFLMDDGTVDTERDWEKAGDLSDDTPDLDDELLDELDIIIAEWADFLGEARRFYRTVPCYTGAR